MTVTTSMASGNAFTTAPMPAIPAAISTRSEPAQIDHDGRYVRAQDPLAQHERVLRPDDDDQRQPGPQTG